MRLFLAGDVMTGRGIDQILAHPSDPALHEFHVQDARDYVRLAESVSGPIPQRVGADYIWGDALAELERRRPDAQIVNLETAVTASATYERKGINYRMHPANLPCLTAAGLDCCVLANNHVLDWGEAGLRETLDTVRAAGIATAGAGRESVEAAAPAVVPLAEGRRLLVFAAATGDSGVPHAWTAAQARAGVQRLEDLGARTLTSVAQRIVSARRPGDRVVFSVHWGGNWGFDIPREQVDFAHGLIDEAGVDVVHGHSSHHVKGAEIYRGRAILYGCGDLITDYEGIGDHAAFRGDLGLLYFPALDAATGHCSGMELAPMRLRRFRLERADGDDRQWLLRTAQREYGHFGLEVEDHGDCLRLRA